VIEPLLHYCDATAAQRLYERAAEAAGLERARAVAAMHAEGMSYADIAALVKLSRSRVQQLVEQGRS
jgi:transposase